MDIKDLGQCKQILGITVSHERQGITLSQDNILSQLLTATGMHQSTPVAAPMTSSYYLSRGSPAQPDSNAHQSLSQAEIKAYQSSIGSLLYVSLGTRPDISFAVSVLCRSMVAPTAADQQALRHLLKYIKGTVSHRLYLGTEQSELSAYSDSSYADCKITGRSTAGYVLLYKGGPIEWKSQLQKVVSWSTAESEYMALSHAAKETQCMQGLMREILVTRPLSIPIYTDNKAALAMATASASTHRTRHMAVRYHYV